MIADTEQVTVEELAAEVRKLRDRADLQDMIFRYATACDQRDEPAWRSLFMPEARARYGKDDWLDGADAIVGWLLTATEPTVWGHHLVNPYAVEVTGDEAQVLTYLLSHQVFEGDLDETAMMTSRYQLRCRRHGTGRDSSWRIQELVLTVGWFEVRRADQSLRP